MNKHKKVGNFTVTQKKQSLICLALSYPACWFKPILTLTNILTYNVTCQKSVPIWEDVQVLWQRGQKTTKKTCSIKWHNMILCAFPKGSWIFQSATKGTLDILVLGWARNEHSSFAFTRTIFADSLQYLRGPACLNPARYIFMAMYLDGVKAK